MDKKIKTTLDKPRLSKLNKKIGTKITNVPFMSLVWVSLAIGVCNILLVLIIKFKLPPEVPLYYGLAEGSEQLSQTLGLTIPGAISIGVTLVNYLIAFLTKNKFLQKIVITTAFCVSFLSIITVVKIVLLVGSF